jgi:uncharacterized membrane protein
MRSQTKWGIFFIVVGAILPVLGFPFTLLYAIPLIALGIGLLILRKREESIEGLNEEDAT